MNELPSSSVSYFTPIIASMSSNNALNLANLPSDIMRNVFDSGLESIDAMRLISQRWQSLLKNRQMLPPIERFYLYHNYGGGCVPMVSIAPRYALYFGVDKWTKRKAGQIQEFSRHFNVAEKYTELKKCLSKLFARSSRVNKCKFAYSKADYLLLIKPILRDICIRELEIGGLVEFSQNQEYLLTKLIRKNSVQKLVLNFMRPAATKWIDSKRGLAKFLPIATHELSTIDLVYILSDCERIDETGRDMWKTRASELAEETHVAIKLKISKNFFRITIEK